MKILILSFYFPPDLAAGSFRADQLVKTLMGMVDQDVELDVITTQPNRYHGFGLKVKDEEVNGCLKIHRIKVADHVSGMLDQAKSFILYAYGVQKIVKNCEYDFICATSGRLMTAALAAYLSIRKNIPLYLDIRDIFVETIQDILPKNYANFLMPIFSLIECITIRRAFHINLVSPGFETYFKKKYPKKSFSFYMNGIDEEFIPDSTYFQTISNKKRMQSSPIKIFYAGNIGEGQGLHKILPLFAQKLGARIQIRILGGGSRLGELQSALIEMGVGNVEVIPPIPRAELIQEYKVADVLFLHLNDHKAFKKVLPSKIFEYAASGKPILAGVSGYAAKFLTSEVDNSAIFSPCDIDGAIKAFESLSIQDMSREKFIRKYLRREIMKILCEDMISRYQALNLLVK